MLRTSTLAESRWRRLAYLRLYCNTCCIGAASLGALAVCGRMLDVELFKSILLGFGVTDVSTALGLTLLGISLWLLLPDPPRPTRRIFGLLAGSAVALAGGLTLVEHAFRVNLHIDRLLVRNAIPAAASHTLSTMSPATAITFLTLGLGLLLLDGESPLAPRISQALTLWGGFAGIMSLSGYISGATATYKVFSYGTIDVHNAIILFFMSAAVFFARPKVGLAGELTARFMGSAMARRFLPAVLIIPILAAWLRMRVQRAGFFGAELGFAFNITVNIVSLSILVWLNARQLNRAEERLNEAEKAKTTLYEASLRDELTGLYNRRGFLGFAEEQIELACMGQRGLLVVFADVDGLKEINDRHGHAEGDRAIQKAGEVLISVFRDTDLVARIGGDEFAVLALDCSTAGLTRINAHLDRALRRANQRDDLWKLSISVGGVVVDSKHQLSIDELLKKADVLMYSRKRRTSPSMENNESEHLTATRL